MLYGKILHTKIGLKGDTYRYIFGLASISTTLRHIILLLTLLQLKTKSVLLLHTVTFLAMDSDV